MFPQKTFLKSLKATELFRKHIFKLKVVNQEGVIILDLGESPGGTLAATTLLGLILHVISVSCPHRTLDKIYRRKPFAYKKNL